MTAPERQHDPPSTVTVGDLVLGVVRCVATAAMAGPSPHVASEAADASANALTTLGLDGDMPVVELRRLLLWGERVQQLSAPHELGIPDELRGPLTQLGPFRRGWAASRSTVINWLTRDSSVLL